MKNSQAIIESPKQETYAARKRLAKAFSDYRKGESEISDYKAKAARALRDTELAMANNSLSEEEAAEAVARSQALGSVYAQRTKSREQSLVPAFSELKEALRAATAELADGIDQLRNDRLAILRERIMVALKAEEELRERREFGFIFEYAREISVLRTLEVPTNVWIWDSPDAELVLEHAGLVLTNFDRLEDEQGREI